MVLCPTMYSDDESQEESYINYKLKYRELKKHLRALIYENECFQDELRKAQRNFVSISRDKSFLLDRILKHEKPVGISSDSDDTESSEAEEDQRPSQYNAAPVFGQRKKITKRKRSDVEASNGATSTQSIDGGHSHSLSSIKLTKPISSKPLTMKLNIPVKKQKRPPTIRKPTAKKDRQMGDMSTSVNVQHLMKSYHMDDIQVAGEEQVHTGASEDYTDSGQRFDFSSEGQMTREDIERHLEARRYSPEIELNTTPTVPAELFNQDPDQESDLEGSEICEFVQLEEDGTSADMILE